jgi:ArsR family transcriptional regulator
MEDTIHITKALADGNRLRVILALTVYDELCVCEITEILGLATPTVSRHMGLLQNARLVKSRKEGRWVYYRLARDFPRPLLRWLKDALSRRPEILRDSENLKKIISGGREKLCASQRRRRAEQSGKR